MNRTKHQPQSAAVNRRTTPIVYNIEFVQLCRENCFKLAGRVAVIPHGDDILAPTYYSPDFRRREAHGFAQADIVRGTWPCCSFFAASFVDQHTLAHLTLEAMTSLNEMSETEP